MLYTSYMYSDKHIQVLETSFKTACVGVLCMNCVGITERRNSKYI